MEGKERNSWVSAIEAGLDDPFSRGREMGHFSSMFNELARSLSIKKGRYSSKCSGDEAVEAMAKEAKKNDLILRSSGSVNFNGSDNFASVYSKRGEKGMNQDCFIVWEEFGGQEDMMFCGIFDGHGPWGHYVAKRVRKTMPSSLLSNWQETLAEASLDLDFDLETDKKLHRFDLWKRSYIRTCAAVDHDLRQLRKINSFSSGTTALTIVRQGELIFVANIGDSRAVLATTSDDGSLAPIQLTIDFKPNLPQEAERIIQSNGRVFCLPDEPGVQRVWRPEDESPGLAMSRAFGDYCVKDFGLISVPEVTQRHITHKDQFVVLATDGVWDVISNEEAVEVVSSTPDRAKAAKRLVEKAVCAWRHKRRGIAMDDISAICRNELLFSDERRSLNCSSGLQQRTESDYRISSAEQVAGAGMNVASCSCRFLNASRAHETARGYYNSLVPC